MDDAKLWIYDSSGNQQEKGLEWTLSESPS
jgi:hypothetical protein